MFMEDVNQAPKSTEPVAEEAKSVVLAGDKTPPNLLLESLQEERAKRKELEDRIALLESSNSSDVFSDEGKILQRKIEEQDEKIKTILQDNVKKDVLIANPILKEKWEEFETFRADPENKGMNMKTAAKAFLLEEGLFEPQRKGLEKTTGGARIPITQGMSADDIKTLRENDPRKYREMIQRGDIKV